MSDLAVHSSLAAHPPPPHQHQAPSFEASSEHSRHPEWINKCRKILITTETTNIASRVCHWRRIVNEKTDLTNERLNIFIPQNLLPKFEWRVNNLSKYIQFVIQWNGLKMKQIKTSPANYEEYERKARNWLNGRRAPNYAGTLFPDMIKASEQYADTVSKHLFGPNNQYSKAYHKILMFGFLHSLCSVRISMNDVSKKTFLLCENSIKTNSVTSVLLQQYATDHPFAQYFPSHLKQAADYFQNKFEMDIKRFGNALRLAAGNNMSVNQINPSMAGNCNLPSAAMTCTATNPLNHALNHNLNMNMNGITGLNINDLNGLNSFNRYSMQRLNGIGLNRMNINNIQFTNTLNGLHTLITTQNHAKSKESDHKSEDKKHIKVKTNINEQLASPLSVGNTTNNNNPFNTNTNIHLPPIPNLSIPPQLGSDNKMRIAVNGKSESVVSFLNQIVSTCNNQQIFMQRLQNRVYSMERIIKQIKPHIDGNNNGLDATHSLRPLPRVQEIEVCKSNIQSLPLMNANIISNTNINSNTNNKHLQFVLNPQMPSVQQRQFQQIQPIHVQQIQSAAIPQQQFVLNPSAASLPNMIANKNKNVTFPKSVNRNHNNNNSELMDDDLNTAAALLASLKHKITPKMEPKSSVKRQRDIKNNTDNSDNHSNSPPIKKRKMEGKNTSNDLQNMLFNAINTNQINHNLK